MEIKIIKSGYGASEISVNEKNMLAVTTNLISKIYKQISRLELLSEPGIIIKDGTLSRWVVNESIEYEGKLIFPGPFYSGKTLVDLDLNIDILINLCTAFKTIISKKIPVTGFFSPGVFIPNDGSILIFPPNLINYITSQLSENESIKYWQPFNHPDAHEEVQFSFILGVLAYKLLSKELPFTGSSITEIREKMRTSTPVGIELLVPGVDKNIAAAIKKSLAPKKVGIDEWEKILSLWKREGAITEISQDEQDQLKKLAVKKQSNRKKQFERKQFLSHNGKIIGTIIAAVVLVISFAIQPIKNAMAPPVTTGMSAEEVVGTFYNAIIDMNVELMEVCVKKGVAKNDINEVTQLFVISRVRSGYEGKTGLISAQDWNDGVISTIESGEQVYGIADLNIEQSDDLNFYADYIKWYPAVRDDYESEEILPPIRIYIKDILTLEKENDVWTIVNLERTTRTDRE